jgi:flagellin
MASFSVVTSVSSLNAQANINQTNALLNRSINRLSSGLRINQAGDDAAGLAVANSYRVDQAVVSQGIRNANDALSNLQIKDGAMANIGLMVDRLATLAAQAASSSTSATTRTSLNTEFADLVAEIDRQANISGLSAEEDVQVYMSQDADGADGSGVVTGTISAVSGTGLDLADGDGDAISIADAEDAAEAVATIKTAVETLGEVSNALGSLQNRLQFAINLATNQGVNFKAAESRVRDANMAEEASNMTKFSILSQSGVAALAQANQQSSAVLSLLR